MKKIFDTFLVILFTLFGELFGEIIPFPIPGSVWGLFLLFVALCLKIIKLEQVDGSAHFLISNMPILFIPVLVGISASIGLISDYLLKLLLIVFFSTFVVFLVTALIVIIINKHSKKK